MGGSTYRIYQEILTRNDAALATVFNALEDVPDIFGVIEGRALGFERVLVFDDRNRFPGAPHMRRWRPTLMLVATDGDAPVEMHPDDVLVLTDSGFPASVRAVPRDLVRPAGIHQSACLDAANLVQMITNFAGGCAQLRSQGAVDAQIVGHPKLRELAAAIHAKSVQFSGTFREGLQLDARSFEPPPGARQLPPALWLDRNASPPDPAVDPPDWAVPPVPDASSTPSRRPGGPPLPPGRRPAHGGDLGL